MEMISLAVGLTVAAVAVPVTAIALHQMRRRRFEKRASFRKKEKIVL